MQAATIPYFACNNTIETINPILSNNKDNSGITYFLFTFRIAVYTFTISEKNTVGNVILNRVTARLCTSVLKPGANKYINPLAKVSPRIKNSNTNNVTITIRLLANKSALFLP